MSPSRWCWFWAPLGVTKKLAHESAFLLSKEHLEKKEERGQEFWLYFLQALRLKALVPSWHNESYCGGFLSPQEHRELENTRHLGLEYCWVG